MAILLPQDVFQIGRKQKESKGKLWKYMDYAEIRPGRDGDGPALRHASPAAGSVSVGARPGRFAETPEKTAGQEGE
jgi:hypothetical protein